LPYTVLLGFVLPYSLYVLRSETPDYPATRVYITDNLGDVTGGAVFSFALVYLVTPVPAVCLAGLPLIAAVCFLHHAPTKEKALPGLKRRRLIAYGGSILVLVISAAALFFETASLVQSEGRLVHYKESRYGRVEVYQNRELFTLFSDGIPVLSSQYPAAAEETIHYPLSQIPRTRHILLVSAVSGMMSELAKYHPETVDYVELDSEVSDVLFRFRLIREIPGLTKIHQDGRAYLSNTRKAYDAIIINLPEPDTFQINRFYTDRFFALAKSRLAPGGILSFSMQGYDNYLAEPQRQKLSSVFNTLSSHFKHVKMLPGQKIYFLCRDHDIKTEIPALLKQKGIETGYVSRFFRGNLTPQRIAYLNNLMDPSAPKNFDNSPWLMRMMFTQWFSKFSTSPLGFYLVLAALSLIYLVQLHREEFVLFSTGCMTMGSEIIVIFAFQIYFGYIYLQIGLIVTVFLAGLLPGAWLGDYFKGRARKVLVSTDVMLIVLMGLLILMLEFGGDRLPVLFYLGFGFVISLACGCQFPVALRLRGEDDPAVARAFSADLIGAACGTLVTSVAMIPYLGITGTIFGLIGLKALSLVLVVTGDKKN